ncbi:MAG: VanZ family protein [Desulfosporosinus sp.]
MLSFIPVGVVAVIVYLFIAIVIGFKRRIPMRRQMLAFVLFVYLLEVIAITLFPIPIDPEIVKPLCSGSGGIISNLVPFSTVVFMIKNNPWRINAFLNIAGNIVLFVPFGLLWPLLFANLNRASRIIPLGFCSTLIVEVSQFTISSILGFTYRSFDVDDMILNTLGVIVGYVLLRLFQGFIRGLLFKCHLFHLLSFHKTIWKRSPSLGC